jgi:hypothetical protein
MPLKPFQRPSWDAARCLHDTRLEPTDVLVNLLPAMAGQFIFVSEAAPTEFSVVI